MDEARAASPPLIRCTPSTDPTFLASVSRAYGEATDFLSSEAGVFVGTLIRLRMRYPRASILPLFVARGETQLVVWLVSREGWIDVELAASPPGRAARDDVALAPRPRARPRRIDRYCASKRCGT
jgi:hypothetical protein